MQVCRAIRCVDAAFALHGLQPFHAHPRPHISVRYALPRRFAAAFITEMDCWFAASKV